MEKKICSKCNIEKKLSEFSADKSKKDGKMITCKTCRKEIETKYRTDNPDKVKLRRKKYYDDNKIKHNEYFVFRRNTDFLFKLSDNLRRRINIFLKAMGITKKSKTYDIIGCSPDFLKEHIENQFRDGMSWDKIGKEIHIDHIIPLSSAKTEEEVYKLCHYTNLQPLWAHENLSKGDRIL